VKSSTLAEALNIIWKTPPELRANVAYTLVRQLSREEVELLTAWDYRATFNEKADSRLVSANSAIDNTRLLSYSDAPWVRVADTEPVFEVHSVAELLLAAQFARDHLDSLLLSPSDMRDRQISALSTNWRIEEQRLRRLFSSFDNEVRQAR